MSTLTRSVAATLGSTRPGTALLAAIRLLRGDSHLHASGWFKSALWGLPQDAHGEPLPWYTYAAIAFLAPRVSRNWCVFEYGSGQSTLWWAARAGLVVVIDGRERVACIAPACAALTPRGVIVWDNSDRERYAEGYALLAEWIGPLPAERVSCMHAEPGWPWTPCTRSN